MINLRRLIGLMLVAGVMGLGQPAQAQSTKQKPLRLPCGAGLVQQRLEPRLIPAAFRLADVTAGQLRIDFAGHSTYLITSLQGVKVATDYNDFYRAKELPDIATMSGWHPNHTTDNIQPSISYALKGWDTGVGLPRHNVRIKDLRVYAVPANIEQDGITFRFPTAIFVVQSQGLCVAHLGLLGHVLEPRTVANIGRIDVLMVPIDQRVTLSFAETIHNIKVINPKVVVPMHYNSKYTVEEFLNSAKAHFPVRQPNSSILIAQKSTLPQKTEIHFLLPPYFSQGF
jgi:hypothetical protein